MKKLFVIISFCCCAGLVTAKTKTTTPLISDSLANVLMQEDSIEKAMKYEHGIINLSGGIGKLNVPAGYKFLNPEQSEYVLTKVWHNPPDDEMPLGLIFPDSSSIYDASTYVFHVYYDEIGYVKDNDADDIKYDELLKDMQKEASEANPARIREGYDSIRIVGWASAPYYDKDRKILHWAKEIKFGNSEEHTLNYNIRFLGRKGVLVINAIAGMKNLQMVKADIPKVLNIVEFSDGYKYKDFTPGLDKVAAWSLGGLVAGKILAKIGFFAIILKFWKIMMLAVVGFFSSFRKKISDFFSGKKKQKPSSNENDRPSEKQALPKPQAQLEAEETNVMKE